MYYKTKVTVVVVEATKLTADLSLHDYGGMGHPGDWLVIDAEGKLAILSEEAFFQQYEPCDDETETPTRFAQEKKRKDAGKPRARKNGLATPVLGETKED